MKTEARIKLDIEGMHCAACVSNVERALRSVPGVREATVSLTTHEANVIGQVDDLGQLEESVEKAGYQASLRANASPADRSLELESKQQQEEIGWRNRLFAAVPLAIAVFVVDWLLPHQSAAVVGVLLAGIAQVYVGGPFYRGAWNRLRHGSADMDTLVAIGTTAAFGYSLAIVLLQSHEHSYAHDSAALLAFITLGKWLESRARGRASHAIRKLFDRTPRAAHRIDDGRVTDIPIEEVRVRNILLVRPGEIVPVDGIITEGSSSLDEAMITGESIPVEKSIGDKIIGGTINQQGMIRFRVSRTGDDTLLSQIVRLVDDAQSSKAGIGRLADRVAGIFVPIVLGLAVVTLIGHAFVTAPSIDWASAIRAAIAVLVVACPCAMGLATPTAIMVASGRGAEMGILIRQAQAIEDGGNVDTIILDKTGTVTAGKPSVVDITVLPPWDEEELIALAASAESTSTHPLADAIVSQAKARSLNIFTPETSNNIPGQGIEATISGRTVLIGKKQFLESRGVADGDIPPSSLQGTPMFVAVDGKLAGRFTLADPVKPTSAEAIRHLRQLGLDPHLVTGDVKTVAEQVAREVGIPPQNIRAEVSPAEKESIVRELEARGRKVAMVGDGINDAPALAAAHLGIAMGQGSDIAKEAGDVILTSNDLDSLVRSLKLCQRTLQKIKQNLVWAFGYNLILIPLAMAGYLPPLFSALAMAASSVSVVTNSLLLRRVRL
jgi:Cu+-exporting ATPase